MNFLVLHGPNLNLMGIRSAQIGERVTLDKINRVLRRQARTLEVSLKILQTHDSARAITFLHRNRNWANGLLFAPASWARTQYDVLDTLQLIGIPFAEVFLTEEFDPNQYQAISIFTGIAVVTLKGPPLNIFSEALTKLYEEITKESSKGP